MRRRSRLGLTAAALFLLAQTPADPAPPPGLVSTYAWRMKDRHFGGFSGVDLSPDGSRIVVLSDRGAWTEGRIERDAAGRITAVHLRPMVLLKGTGEAPLKKQAAAEGKRMVRTKFGVDEDVCTGDHACMRLSGCPSLTVKHLDDPLRDDPVASIDENCDGCGNCGEVADAAVLCPSFYQADVVFNPTGWDRFLFGLRQRVISALQRRRERGRPVFGERAA